MKRLLAGIVFGFCLALFSASTGLAADCQFVLGFKTIRDLIGHDTVGECLDSEHYNAIGDSVQHTTGGLLAWRKADNWTAFTDGYRTWVNGPNGLQQRLNTERFEWEADYAEITGQAAASALTRDSLRNAEYAANFPSYGTLQRDRIGAQDPLAFGDLNGDGIEDAAVVLLLVDGNAGHRYLAAVLNENGAPRHVASVFLGLNIGIDSVTIADGVVTLQTKQLGPNDPTCCPTKEVVATFRLNDNDWKLVAETPPGQVTANFNVHADANTIATALEALRSTELGETVAAWFLDSGGSVTFDDSPFQNLADIPEIPFAIALDLQENAINIESAHRGESAEAVAAWLAGSMTQSISLMLEGDPSSVAACFDLIQLAYHARAAVWYEFYGDEGKPNPNSQQAFLNQNLQRATNGILAGWVRDIPFYREFCGQFAAPPTPTPVPTAIPLTRIPAPRTTPISRPPVEDTSCLSAAELDYLLAFQASFWESTRESSNTWITTEHAAGTAYFGEADITGISTERTVAISLLQLQAVEALRLHGAAVYAAIDSLPSPPTTRTAQLLELAVQSYQAVEAGYFSLLELNDSPLWIYIRVASLRLSSLGVETFEDLLGIALQFDTLAAKARCQ